MKILKIILKHNYCFKIMAIIIILISLIYTKYHQKESSYQNEDTFIGIVNKIKISDDKIIIYLKAKETLLINYYGALTNIELGDKIKVNGTLEKPTKNTIPNLFNYQKYLYNNNIFYLVKASKIEKIANNTSII